MLSGTRFILAAVLLVVAGTASAASGSPVANSATFVDDRHELKGAPDISTVIVSNDDTGRLSFRVNTPGRQRLTQDMRVRVTFGIRGRLYFLLADPYKPFPVKVALYRIEPGLAGVPVGRSFGGTSLTFRYAHGARFSFDISEFGIDTATDRRVPIALDATITAGLRKKPEGGFDFSDVGVDRAPSKHPRTFRYVAVFGS